MADYDNTVSRDDASALIPEEVATTIIAQIPTQSAALSLFRRAPNMSRKQERLPVVSVLPTASFVNGDTGLKKTSRMAWANKFLNAEPLAVIVPIAEDVLDDADYPLWDQIRPAMVEAVGLAVDDAIFFGVNKPASWPTAIVTDAIAKGNVVHRGTNAANAGGLAQDISDLFSTVENDGFDVNGLAANKRYKGFLRGARNAQGDQHPEVNPKEAYGVGINYPLAGLWPATGDEDAEMVAGDFTQGIIAIRQDITWKLLTEAVIQDDTGAIVYNLPQQDMVAMRVVMRLAWQVANPITRDNPNDATRYPFGVMQSPNV